MNFCLEYFFKYLIIFCSPSPLILLVDTSTYNPGCSAISSSTYSSRVSHTNSMNLVPGVRQFLSIPELDLEHFLLTACSLILANGGTPSTANKTDFFGSSKNIKCLVYSFNKVIISFSDLDLSRQL
ncbi:hypothetical protein WICPIJ_003742 [Wickerhamomyces pijperi]|uniref:Uncharacterized protein n=1 Tax=Wickerhamomyces pijperi TaxID=599730 RepID=A0A9P8Q6V5_WICPI|nr:hypothetical protein WICPIJ_003742 [Wickerhamomyces pijperi]